MALTRKMLKAMGIEDEKVDQIIDAHTETVDALKEQRDTFKADAEKLPDIQKKLDTATLAAAENAAKEGGKDAYKVKYDALKEEFDSYKAEQDTKAAKSAKEAAYKALLKDLNVSDKVLDKVARLADLDALELVDGKLKDADKLGESIKADWADFIGKVQETGARTDTPPGDGGAVDTSKMTDAEYFAYQAKAKLSR